jgi:hypothetical protein
MHFFLKLYKINSYFLKMELLKKQVFKYYNMLNTYCKFLINSKSNRIPNAVAERWVAVSI